MSTYQQHEHDRAYQQAQAVTAELWLELPEIERNDAAAYLLERYLASSDAYRCREQVTGRELAIYVRKRATEFYIMCYQQEHHTPWNSLRMRGRLEKALAATMGNPPVLLTQLNRWNKLRLESTIRASISQSPGQPNDVKKGLSRSLWQFSSTYVLTHNN